MTSEPLVLSIDDAIDRLGTGPFQHKILIAAGSCFMADAMEAMLLSFLALILEKEWNLSKEQTATIISLVFIGAMVGNLIFGPAGDLIGRRPIFFICSLTIGIFGIGTSFVQGYFALILLRFVVGIGLGGLTVPFDILAEFLPTQSRGTYLILINLFWTLGSVLTVFVAYCTIGQGIHWRWFVSLCAIPCFISMVLVYFFVPESPHWLVSQGRAEDALKILYRGALDNCKDPMSLFPAGCRLRSWSMESPSNQEVNPFTPPTSTEPKNRGNHQRSCFRFITPLFTRVMLILSLVWFGSTFGYYGTIIAVARIFSNMDSENSQQASFDYGAFFISSCAEIVGAAIVWRTIERIGRVPIIVVALSGAGLSLFLLCFMVSFGRKQQIFIAFSSRTFEMIISSTVWIITPELLNTEVRTSGHGVASAIARIGGCLSPYIVTGASLPTVGIIMLIVHTTTALIATRLPETRGSAMGRSVSAPLIVHGPHRIERNNDINDSN